MEQTNKPTAVGLQKASMPNSAKQSQPTSELKYGQDFNRKVDLNWPSKSNEWSIQASPTKQASKEVNAGVNSATAAASDMTVEAAAIGSNIPPIETAAFCSSANICTALSVTPVEAAAFNSDTTASVIVGVEAPTFATIVSDEITAPFRSSMYSALTLASPPSLTTEAVIDDDEEEAKQQQQQQQVNAHLDANFTASDDRALQLYLTNTINTTTDINTETCNTVPPPPRRSTPPVGEFLVLGTYTYYGTFVSGNPALDTPCPREIVVLVSVDARSFSTQTTHSINEIIEEEEVTIEEDEEEEEEVVFVIVEKEKEKEEEVVGVVEEKKKEEAMMLPLWTLFEPNPIALSCAHFGCTTLAYEEQTLPLWFLFSGHNLAMSTAFFSTVHEDGKEEIPTWMLFQEKTSPWKLASVYFGHWSVEFEDRDLPLYYLLDLDKSVSYLFTCWHFLPAKTEAQWLIANGFEEEEKVEEPTWRARVTKTLGTFMKRVTTALVSFSKRAGSWFIKNPVTHHFL